MQRHVGGVDVEDEFARCPMLRRDELLDQHPVQGHHIGARGVGLQAGEREAADQCFDLALRRLRQRIVPPPVMVVEILVAATQTVKPLGHQILQGVRSAVLCP